MKRPTKDGIVTCIEGFDYQGVSIFSIFGQRIEGTPELQAWQDITAKIVAEYSLEAAEVAEQDQASQITSTESELA